MSLIIDGNYTATAQVGRDTIENAVYHEFEFTTSEKATTFKDKLEDLWDTITCPFRRVRRWVIDTYWEIRYGFQRMFKGYDAVDTFDTFSKFVERYEKILKEYRSYHYGYPTNMTEEEWDAVVDDMIYHLHYMDEHNVEDELSKGMPENWHPSSITTYEIMERHKDEFFKLFSKHFYSLWD
jgi:predicted AlkP superfamily phosphohydrolase/phosphomutase